jgi:cysteine desulfurase
MTIYLDHAATSPMPPEVIAAYASALTVVGNPSSVHSQGQNAKQMLEDARDQVAASLGADPVEVTLTSGGTESINLAIKGLYWSRNDGGTRRPRILVTHAEHHATLDSAEWLEEHEGAEIEWMPVDSVGKIDLVALEKALGDDVALVTILLGNNEVGTIQPIARIVELAAARGVPVHCDAVSAYGYIPIDFRSSGLTALSVSAHKIGGPVSIGALLLSRTATVTPLIHGGNQQRARSGTQDAAGAAAFGAAASLVSASLDERAAHLRHLRDRLVEGVRVAVPAAVLRGDTVDRLPGNAHFTFPGCEGDSLVFLLDLAGFSVSAGSACSAGVAEASHVLNAMGLSYSEARGALRITLGHDTTEGDIDAFLAALPEAAARAGVAGYANRETTVNA